MSVNISEMEFSLFQKFILDKCGIELAPEKAYLIESRLTKILVDLKCNSFGELYRTLQSSHDDKLVQRLIDAITTNETLWFRDKLPWRVMENLLLPQFIEDLKSGKKDRIRIWSAATSTGQEAYSTAMCIDNYLKTKNVQGVSLKQFEIIGTDISRLVLEIAKNGRYDSIAITRGLDKTLKSTYFTQRDNAWEIIPPIKQAVQFHQFNLQNSFASFGTFDIIFCRYVLIYFSDILKTDIIKRMNQSLKVDGTMFLGAYEMCSHLSSMFESKLFENGVYYTKALEKKGV